MKTFIQITNRSYRPKIEHPVGKFCLRFMKEDEFLFENSNKNPYLTSGFPMLARTKDLWGKVVDCPEDKIQYYDRKEEAQNRLDSMSEDWREAYEIVEVTENGLIHVK